MRVGPGPVKGGEDHRLLAPGTGGGTPSSRRDQARRQTPGRGMERNLLRIVLNCSSHGHALGKCRVLLPPDMVKRQ